MGCGSSNNNAITISDADDPTKGARLSENGPGDETKPKKTKKGLDKNADGSRTLDLSGTILEQPGDVRDYYTFDKVLGKGNFGVVHLVYEKKTNLPYACKSISKRKLVTEDDIGDVQREIQILLHLGGHAHVVQMYGAYEDKGYIHLVMEVCAGGELFDRIAERGHFSEKAAADLMRTIVSVVNHCHTMNVVHRDLKPENFLLSEKGLKGVLKATDFGLSRFFVEGRPLDEIVGSPFYVAPEVLQKKYGKEADIWSCGVILYILLCGWPPFHGDSTQQIFRNIMTQPLDLKSEPWDKISPAAKDCVKRMLCRDVSKRLTAAQLLKHPWMKANGVATDESLTPEVLTRLRQYGKMNNFKKEALKIVARALPQQEIHGIREMFQAIDEDGSGCITIDELREGLKKKGAELKLQEVEKIVSQIDVNGNHLIDYEEFIAATIHLNKLNREELLMEAFRFFDKDESGYITQEELLSALKETGVQPSEVKAILDAADTNSDGEIDYEEFCLMMRDTEFEALVKAKTALRSHIFIDPTKHSIVDGAKVPEDEKFDEVYSTRSMYGLVGDSPEQSTKLSATHLPTIAQEPSVAAAAVEEPFAAQEPPVHAKEPAAEGEAKAEDQVQPEAPAVIDEDAPRPSVTAWN